MYYEINVSLNGKHFFATHERSIRSEAELRRVLPAIVEKFPESEGYKVSVTKWETIGKEIEIMEV